MDINYLRTIHRSVGIEDGRDLKISDAQQRIIHDMQTSVNYFEDAKRNGKTQPMVLVPTKTRYKCSFLCLPGDEIYSGDILECNGEHWIVIETNTSNPIQHIGMAWLCNHEFAFQNWTSEVITRYGVLDSGVYSTTSAGDGHVRETDKQFKVYLPFDADTEKLYVDKRIAVDKRYNSYGQEILECYQISGANRVARSYGQGAHLLILELRSDNYSPEHDNVDLLICDYIAPEPEPENKISGNTKVPIGVSRRYSVVAQEGAVLVWSCSDPSIVVDVKAIDPTKATVTVPNDPALIGQTFVLTCSDTVHDKDYTIEVGVT